MADEARATRPTIMRVRDWNNLYENNRTRGLKRMEWVPVPNRMDGDGFTELMDHPNGVAHFGCWNLCLQVASRCHPRGSLAREDGRPHDAVSLARITRAPAAMFEEAIPRLLHIGWLENVSQSAAGIPHDPAVIPHEPAAALRVTDYGMEGNGRERNGLESGGVYPDNGAEDDFDFDAEERFILAIPQNERTDEDRLRLQTLQSTESMEEWVLKRAQHFESIRA